MVDTDEAWKQLDRLRAKANFAVDSYLEEALAEQDWFALNTLFFELGREAPAVGQHALVLVAALADASRPSSILDPHVFGTGTGRGREGVEKYVGEFRAIWDCVRMIGTPELRDVDGERVLVLGRVMTRGAGSGVSVESPLGQLYEFRDGRISSVRTYLDHGEALRAAGLTE